MRTGGELRAMDAADSHVDLEPEVDVAGGVATADSSRRYEWLSLRPPLA